MKMKKVVTQTVFLLILLVQLLPQAQGQCPLQPCFLLNACPLGHEVDAAGCEKCECKQQESLELPCPGEDAECFKKMGCVRGFIKTDRGCRLCQCQSTCDVPPCLARMTCLKGFRKDMAGCDTCACLATDPPGPICPKLDCLVTTTCRYGFKVDDRPCPICQCRDSPRPVCFQNACPSCTFGYVIDKDGCSTCVCRDRPIACATPMCSNQCDHGYRFNTDGCMTCKCQDPPSVNTCDGGVVCSPGQTCKDVDNKLVPVYQCVDNSAGYQHPCSGVSCSQGRRCISYGMDTPVCLPLSACRDLVRCRMFCNFGLETDMFGCDTCICRSTPKCVMPRCRSDQTCKRVRTKLEPIKRCVASFNINLCAEMSCASGPCMVIGARAACINPPMSSLCKEPDCELTCQYGLQKDGNGCEICRCNPTPTCISDAGCTGGLVCRETNNKLVPNYQCVGQGSVDVCSSGGVNCPHNINARCYNLRGRGPVCIALAPCGPVCAIYCEHGNVMDEKGCATCECLSLPCKGGCGFGQRCLKVSYDLTPVKTCVAPDWYDDCALMFCAQLSIGCIVLNGKGQCLFSMCPRLRCNLRCADGYETDERDCKICQCKGNPTCTGLLCPAGQHCELRPVECIRAPCPPQRMCVVNAGCQLLPCRMSCEFGLKRDNKGCDMCECKENPCNLMDCGPESDCEVIQPTCITTPCDKEGMCTLRRRCTDLICEPCPLPNGFLVIKKENGCIVDCTCEYVCENHRCPPGEVCALRWPPCARAAEEGQDVMCRPFPVCSGPPPTVAPCPPVTCGLLCEGTGYVKDIRGCDICRCQIRFHRTLQQSCNPPCSGYERCDVQQVICDSPPCASLPICRPTLITCPEIACARCTANRFLMEIKDHNGCLQACNCLDFFAFCRTAQCMRGTRCVIRSSSCQDGICLKNNAVCFDPVNDP